MARPSTGQALKLLVRTYREGSCRKRSGQNETESEEPIPLDRRTNIAEATNDAGRRGNRYLGSVRLRDAALGGVIPPSFPTQAGKPPYTTTTAGR
jgi:hypothetical protein